MAKFNKKADETTVNRSGYPAFKMDEKEQLVTAALTTMFGEPKFYGSTDSDIVLLATRCAKYDPEFLCKLTCYARNVGNMRSVSHVLSCVIAHEAHEFTRTAIRSIVLRPDDITEIMACYLNMYGKPFPNAMKREIASVIQKFDEYQLAKYNGGKKEIKLRDVLRITHPVPKDKQTEELLGKILNDTLETPYTWETELSANGNTKKVWDKLIDSGKVGYMALLRNLKNIIRSNADIGKVLKTIADPYQVRKSRQLPFRFYSAYCKLSDEHMMTPDIQRALEAAISASVSNMEPILGRTLIAVDVSGSMGCPISRNSNVYCCDIAALLGTISGRMCEDATVCYFSRADSNSSGYHIERYGKYDPILEICRKNSFSGGGTDLSLPMKYALEEDQALAVKPFDRVIYFSDNECNDEWSGGLFTAVQEMVDEYRKKYNSSFWVHGIDLMGYGTQQFKGDKFNLIAGWSESVLPFINTAEKGLGTLVTAIEKYDI